jgi:hypothetical protein
MSSTTTTTHQSSTKLTNIDIKPYESTRDEILNTISIIDSFILVIGTFGNLISFYLLTRKKLRPMSTMRYLAILCFIDTICLYGWYLSSIYRQLSGDGIKRIENINSFACKFFTYLSFTSLQLSSVMLCCLTIDRLLVIVSSRWRSKYSTPKFANIILLIAAAIICLLNLIIPIRLGNGPYVDYNYLKNRNINMYEYTTSTTPMPDITKPNVIPIVNNKALNRFNYTTPVHHPQVIICYNEFDLVLRAWNKLHLCLYSLVPFPILCILNLVVIRMIRVAAQTKDAHKRLKQGQQFVIRLLLFLTLSFLFSTLPSTIVYAFWRNQVLSLKYGRVLLNLLNTLQFSRHSSNWLIYMYSSSYMRVEFKKCILCNENDYEIENDDLNENGIEFSKPSLSSSFFYKLQMQNNNIDSEYFNYKNIFDRKRSISEVSGESQCLNGNYQAVATNQMILYEIEKLKKLKKVKSMPNAKGVGQYNARNYKIDTSI